MSYYSAKPPLKACGSFGFTLLIMAFLAMTHGTAISEVTVKDRERLEFLAMGMKAARARVRTIRATLESVTIVKQDGKPTRKTVAGPRIWVSLGDRYRYEGREQVYIDGKELFLPTDPEPGSSMPAPSRTIIRSFSGKNTLDYWPEINSAWVSPPNNSIVNSPADRMKSDPTFTGLLIVGLTLEDLMAGRSWQTRPEDMGDQAERIISWGGTREYQGRTVEVVKVDVKWEKSNGSKHARYFEVLIDPTRGFTVPFIRCDYELNGERGLFDLIETECREYNDGIWAAKSTRRAVYIGCPKPIGVATFEVTISELQFNTPVSESELKVNLADGTSIKDSNTRMTYRYRVLDDQDVTERIEQAIQEAALRPVQAKLGMTVSKAQQGTRKPTVAWSGLPASQKGSNFAIWVLAGLAVLGVVVCIAMLGRSRRSSAA